MVVAVEVIGRNVHQHPDMRPEPIHSVQLERTQFQYIPIVVARSDRPGETLADVAAEGDVHPRVAHDLVDKRRGGGLPVRSGDADTFGLAHIAARELHFGDHRNARLADLAHHRGRIGNAGRLDDLRGREDALLGVAALLVGDLPFVQLGLVTVGNAPRIGEEDPEPLLFGEDRGTVAADSPAQNDDLFHIILFSALPA